MTLPLEKRAELAHSLIASLDQVVDEDAEIAWHRRLRAP
jgi:hypothetical protein